MKFNDDCGIEAQTLGRRGSSYENNTNASKQRLKQHVVSLHFCSGVHASLANVWKQTLCITNTRRK